MKGSGPGLTEGTISAFPVGTEETAVNLIQYSRCLGWEAKWWPPKFNIQARPLKPSYSVYNTVELHLSGRWLFRSPIVRVTLTIRKICLKSHKT